MRRTWTEQQLIDAVKASISVAEILRKLNLRATGANYTSIKNNINSLNLDISHMLGMGYLKGKTHNFAKCAPVKTLMIKNGKRSSVKRIKDYLIKNKILEYKCAICGIFEWSGQNLVLQIDHINGNNCDNRLTNLRLICPNCHSQTPTFNGRNLRGRKYVAKRFCKCGKELRDKRYKMCQLCYSVSRPKPDAKMLGPELELAKKLAIEIGLRAAGQKFGISHTTLRKRLQSIGFSSPKRNQWKKYAA